MDFLLILSNINNKIPDWIKLLFKKLFLFIVVVFILLVYYIIIQIVNKVCLIKICIFISSLIISFDLLNLYLMHKFTTKNVKISEVLPDFIINWLKELEVISRSEVTIKSFKKIYYVDISIYLTIAIINCILIIIY